MYILFKGLEITNHAKTAQMEAVSYLEKLGFTCQIEHYVKDRGDGKRGRIDIIAKKNGKTIAIEFDNKTPRKKSLYKLNHFDADFKFVLLRGGEKQYKEGDIYVSSVKLQA